jgi:hypothetical protein
MKTGQAPSGSAIASATAGASSVTLTGLSENTEYAAYALVGGSHRYVTFSAGPDSPRSSGINARVDDLEERTDSVETESAATASDLAAVPAPRLPRRRKVTLSSPAVATPTLIGGIAPVLIGLSANLQTTYWRSFNNICVSVDHGANITQGKNFNDSTWTVEGIIETPDDEVLISVRKSTDTGQVWRSTGWNVATGAATSWTKVLDCSGTNCYPRTQWGFNGWGVAPAWSKHAGSIFIAEYGPQADTVGTPSQAAVRAWMSDDDGVTWTEIFNLLDEAESGDTRLHTHGCCYDPYSGRVFISAGDGGHANPGRSAVYYSDDFDSATPTWATVEGTVHTSSENQVTALIPVEAGIIMLPDGPNEAIKLLPRKGTRRFDALYDTAVVLGPDGTGYIGGRGHRNGYNEQVPDDAPILLCNLEPTGGTARPVIYASTDGTDFKPIYRHTTAVSSNAPGFQHVFGPTADGKIVANLNLSGTTQVFTATYASLLAEEPSNGDALLSGEANMDRRDANSSSTALGTQTQRLGYFTARKTETITQVRVPCGAVAAGATPTLVRVGVYRVEADGGLTLIASTPNDTTLLAATNTLYTKGLSASFEKVAGVRYAIGPLVVTAATAPQIMGANTGVNVEMAVEPRICATVTGQSDLPATIASGSLGNTTAIPYAALLP